MKTKMSVDGKKHTLLNEATDVKFKALQNCALFQMAMGAWGSWTWGLI